MPEQSGASSTAARPTSTRSPPPRLGVFDALTHGRLGSHELAAACGADPSRLAVLCDALVGLELLERDDDRYALTPASAVFLARDSDRSMQDLLIHAPGPWENWPALDETVRGAPPRRAVDAQFYGRLVRATFSTQLAAAERTAPLLGPIRHLLDLGAGAAPWTVGLLRANPQARATVNDLEPVLEAARDELRRAGIHDRSELLPGDYFDAALPSTCDALVLAHVLRAEGAARAPSSCSARSARSCPEPWLSLPTTSSTTIAAAPSTPCCSAPP